MLRDLPARDALVEVESKLRELLDHPGMNQNDKASIVLASTKLSAIRQRHLGRWTPVNPNTLPPRKPGQQFPKLPAGRLVDWEREQEAGNA